MHLTGYLIILLSTAFAGWAVAKISLYLLFYPVKPVAFFGCCLQGIIAKNKPTVAAQLGKWAANELISYETIEKKITDPECLKELRPEIELHIDHFLRVKLKEVFPMLFSLIGDKTISQLKAAFLSELETLFPTLMKSYLHTLTTEIHLEKIITEKLNAFSTENITALVQHNLGKQLRQFQLLGLGIGLFIGLVQGLLIHLLLD